MADVSRIADLRLIMIGPTPPPFGGTTVSFQALQNFLEPRVRVCIVIDTVKRGGGIAFTAMGTVMKLIRNIRNADVVTLHFSDRASISIAPLLWLVCRISGTPCVFRQFGGQFHHTFANLPNWHQWLLTKTIFRSTAIFLQTKEMVKAFGEISNRIHWFPTARPLVKRNYKGVFAGGGGKVLRCLFLGHVSKDKGVLKAVHAIGETEGATLDIYGPLIDIDEKELAVPRVRYCGSIPSEEVEATMAEYDVMLFPTMHPGEGYSGALVEAAMVGLPIVATRWQALPEMFSEAEVLFVQPDAPEELEGRLRDIFARPTLLAERSERLVRRAPDFDADKVFESFLNVCADVASNGNP